MTDDGGRLETEFEPDPRQRDLQGEQNGLLDIHFLKSGPVGRGGELIEHRAAARRAHGGIAGMHPLAEAGVRAHELPAHTHPVRTAAGEHQRHPPVAVAGDRARDDIGVRLPRGDPGKSVQDFLTVASEERHPVVVVGTPGRERVGEVGHPQARVAFDVVGQLTAGVGQRSRRVRRDGYEMHRFVRRDATPLRGDVSSPVTREERADRHGVAGRVQRAERAQQGRGFVGATPE